MKTIVQIVCLAVGLGMIAGCATSAPPSVTSDPTLLRVGITPNSPPMIYKQGGQVLGIEAEIAQALGRELNRKVVFVELKREALLDALDEDKADILMSALSITPARRFRMAFSDPYLKVGQMALVRNEDKYKVNLANTAKRGVGVKPATTAEYLMGQEFPRAIVKHYDSGEQAAAALIDQRLDVFVSDSPMIWYLGSRYEAKGLTVAPVILTEEHLGWGLRRTDDSLRASVNVFLQKIQQNGELQTILQRWMPGFR